MATPDDPAATGPRILFVTPSADLRGGAEHSLVELTSRLRDCGYAPTVVTPAPGTLADALSARDVPVVHRRFWWWCTTHELRRPRTRAVVTRQAIGTPIRAWRGGRTIARLARQADLVVTNTIVTPAGAVGARLARRPHVWWIREFGDLDHHFTFFLGYAASARMVRRLSDRVVTNSDAVARHLGPFIPATHIFSIPNGVDLAPGPALTAPSRGEPIRALSLGAITRRKGTLDAVRAVAALHDRGVAVSLRIVGSADAAVSRELDELRETLGVTDAVEVLSATDDPIGEIDRAHVVLMTSEAEAFGRVTLEALKRGRPVIGTRSGGTPEVIDAGVTGVLYRPGDVEALATTLHQFADDPSTLVAMGHRAAVQMADRFTVERQMTQVRELFDSLGVSVQSRP